jgi:hypothetical protein
LKCAYSLERLESDEEETYESVRLDKLLGSMSEKKKTADQAEVSPEAFCYKRSSVRLTGVPARITPKAGEAEKFEWIRTVNVARPGEAPQPAVMVSDLLRTLSTKRWVTRRVYVREPSLTASRKSHKSRPATTKLHAFLESELARQ